MSLPRVVVDTSVHLTQARSGLRESRIWIAIRNGSVVPLVSRATYLELRNKLGDPKFGISAAERDSILAEYLSFAEYTPDVPDSGSQACPTEDKPFVDLAMAKEADVIVSADRGLLRCNGLWDFPVLTVTEFVRRYL